MRILSKNYSQYFILRVIIVLFILNLFSCSDKDTWYFNEGGTLIWVDERHPDQAIKTAIHQTLEHSSIIVAQISWNPNDDRFFNNTAWYHSLAKNHGKSFMINIDWQKLNRSGTSNGWSFADPKVSIDFKQDVKKLIKTYQPNYINLGVEVNYYALTSSEGFRAFVEVFRELKSELKKSNPNLKVGLSYQLELLFGHHKGWNQERTLETLDAVIGELDFLGISTYPDMISEKHPDLTYSLNYLDSLTNKYSTYIGISETGVSSSNYDDEKRQKYLRALFDKTNNLDLKFVIWGSIIDAAQDLDWSDRIGLLDVNGNTKKEFSIWKTETEKIFK